MKKVIALFAFILLFFPTETKAWWTALYDRGTPWRTYYLGDILDENFKFAVNQETSPMTVSSGMGFQADGSDWTWNDAVWFGMDGPNNRVWISNYTDFVLSQTGNLYYAGRFVWTANGYTEYASADWAENRTSLTATSFITINALPDPESASTETMSSSRIDLTWELWNEKQVMIVRIQEGQEWTDPDQGTAYIVGNNIGDGEVIYHGIGTELSDTYLTSSTTYEYKIYSVNSSYYSSGLWLTATTESSSSDFFRSAGTGLWTAVTNWESSNDNDHWVYATLTPDDNASSVVIRNGHNITLTGLQSATNLSVEENGTITFGDGTTAGSIETDITNNGTVAFNQPGDYYSHAYSISGAGGLIQLGVGNLWLEGEMTYTGNTTISNGELWLYTSPASATIAVEDGGVLRIIYDIPVTVNDITISGAGTLLVDYSKALTISGNLTNNGEVELLNMDNNGSSGSLIVEGNISGTGTFKYDLTVEGSTNWGSQNTGWHFLSSPVEDQPIIDFTSTGVNNDYDFYGYHEPTRQWVNYKEDPDDDPKFSIWNGSNFMLGRGYLVSYQQDHYGLIFEGDFNHSDITLTNLSETESAGKGWHLLGNPFPSAIEWNNGDWALTNVAGTAKIWNSANESYTDLAASEVIPAAQGFFIQVEESTNSLVIPKSARIHANGFWYKSDDNLAVKLSARPVDGSSAQASLIRIHPEASENFDFYYDSRFITGGAPLFYSHTEGEHLSTNTLPSLSSGQEIPYGFVKNEHSDFAIELIENNTGMPVYLTDLKTGSTAEISQNPIYTFTASEGDAPNRFKLTFGSVGIQNQDPYPLSVFVSNRMLNISPVSNGMRVEIFTVTGSQLLNTEVGSAPLSLPFSPGIYIVRITTQGLTHAQKILIK